MAPRVSIIIPCYNQGEYLREAIESVVAIKDNNYEIIIVDDGSNDACTLDILTDLRQKGYRVISQKNKGLGAARNTAIRASSGEFILPLDCDNRIRPTYFTMALPIMESSPTVAVVYGNAAYFGAKSGVWAPGAFNLQRLMLANYIDACALIRKSVIEEVGGYDEKMEFMGWEDWDLWLRISFAGYKMHYVDEVLYDYRYLDNSMGKALYKKYERPNKLERYVNEKYADKMGQEIVNQFFVSRFRSNPLLFVLKMILRAYFPRYYKKLLSKHKIRNWI